METRTIRAENMLAALELVKKELGSDAIVISVRQVLAAPAWQVWQKPMIEVLAMKGKEESTPILSKQESSVKQSAIYERKDIFHVDKSENDENRSFIENLKSTTKESEEIKSSPEGSNKRHVAEKPAEDIAREKSQVPHKTTGKKQVLPPNVKKYEEYLLQQGINEQLIQLISKNCTDALSEHAFEDAHRVKEYFKIQLAASLRFMKQKDRPPRVICLVGSSGSGKTSTCAKLIIRLSNELGKKVTWVCADTNKISAIAEARIYAETIGVPLKLAYTPEELSSIVRISELESNYVVIDTPAINPFSQENLSEIRTLLQAIPQTPIWLVTAASTSNYIQSNIFTMINSFNLKGLVFTKMDETSRFGDVFSFAWQSQLPLTYFSIGSKILDDLKPAEAKFLINALFEER